MTDDKPLTVRCRACGWIYPNTPTDKGYHRANCPYDLKLRIQKLEQAIEQQGAALPPAPEEVPWDDDADILPDDEAVTVSPVDELDEDDEEDEDEPLPVARPLTI